MTQEELITKNRILLFALIFYAKHSHYLDGSIEEDRGHTARDAIFKIYFYDEHHKLSPKEAQVIDTLSLSDFI